MIFKYYAYQFGLDPLFERGVIGFLDN